MMENIRFTNGKAKSLPISPFEHAAEEVPAFALSREMS
jgi:hypothetical protein